MPSIGPSFVIMVARIASPVGHKKRAGPVGRLLRMRRLIVRSEVEVELAQHLGGVELDGLRHRRRTIERVVAVEGPAALDAEADAVGERVLDTAADGA